PPLVPPAPATAVVPPATAATAAARLDRIDAQHIVPRVGPGDGPVPVGVVAQRVVRARILAGAVDSDVVRLPGVDLDPEVAVDGVGAGVVIERQLVAARVENAEEGVGTPLHAGAGVDGDHPAGGRGEAVQIDVLLAAHQVAVHADVADDLRPDAHGLDGFRVRGGVAQDDIVAQERGPGRIRRLFD